jgi:hypothetical protein
MLNVVGVRCDDGDFLIIATNASPKDAIDTYQQRWQIENFFVH